MNNKVAALPLNMKLKEVVDAVASLL